MHFEAGVRISSRIGVWGTTPPALMWSCTLWDMAMKEVERMRTDPDFLTHSQAGVERLYNDQLRAARGYHSQIEAAFRCLVRGCPPMSLQCYLLKVLSIIGHELLFGSPLCDSSYTHLHQNAHDRQYINPAHRPPIRTAPAQGRLTINSIFWYKTARSRPDSYEGSL